MKYDKNIFDYRDLPQNVKKKLHLDTLAYDVFREKIYNLFDIAKSSNINQLSESQITVAYYRMYTSKDPKDIKTISQIRAKLRSIMQCNKQYVANNPEQKIKLLKRVANEKEIYTIE